MALENTITILSRKSDVRSLIEANGRQSNYTVYYTENGINNYSEGRL